MLNYQRVPPLSFFSRSSLAPAQRLPAQDICAAQVQCFKAPRFPGGCLSGEMSRFHAGFIGYNGKKYIIYTMYIYIYTYVIYIYILYYMYIYIIYIYIYIYIYYIYIIRYIYSIIYIYIYNGISYPLTSRWTMRITSICRKVVLQPLIWQGLCLLKGW